MSPEAPDLQMGAPSRSQRNVFSSWPGTAPWWGWACVLFLLYALFALAQHQRLGTTGYDLGIFTQAVRGYAELGAPRSDLKGWGFNLYGDHFHPILVLLVPLYWVWPRAQTLLVAQAALLAIAVVPLARLAARRLGRPGGHAVAAAYGLSFGVQGAVAFDFHEVAFAAPLLAFSMTALSEGRFRTAAWWALPLLAVKEELALTVAAIGIVMALRGRRALGLALSGAGLTCFVLIVGVLIPAFNPDGVYPYFKDQNVVEHLTKVPQLLVWPPEKTTTLLLLGALTCFLAMRSPLVLVALPTIGVRFLRDVPAYWSTAFHYSLPLMPVLFAAALDAQPKWVESRWPLPRYLGRHAGAALLCAAAPLAPTPPLQNFLLHPVTAFTPGPHAEAAYALMHEIPDGAVVEASNKLSPHLVHRTRVTLWALPEHPPDWVIIDTTEYSWSPEYQQYYRTHLADLLTRGYRQIHTRDGIALLHRTTDHK